MESALKTGGPVPLEKVNVQSTEASIDIPSDSALLVADQRKYYLTQPDGGKKTLLYSEESSPLEMASLSPSATRFAYFINNFVYIQEVTTKKTVTLNKEIIGSIGGPLRWSPDETKLAMTCANAQQPSFAVCLLDTQSGQIDVLINEKNTDQFCASSYIELLDWSKDGSAIFYDCFMFPAYRQKQTLSIYVYEVASKTTKQIFDSTSQDLIWEIHSASISPNNTLLLINGAKQDHVQQIFLLDLSDGSVRQVTKEMSHSSSASVWRSDNNTFYVHTQNHQSPYEESNFIMNTDGEIINTVEIEGTIIK